MASYFGIARVEIKDLHIVEDQHRSLLETNVKRLVDIFERFGCRRHEESFAVCAIVDENHLQDALNISAVLPQDLLTHCLDDNIPILKLQQVYCLHGHHRLEAAKRYLPVEDRWWPVRLYSASISLETRRRLVETFDNDQPCTDGEIFWKIRHYNLLGMNDAEQDWWSRLSSDRKRTDLVQLLANRPMREAFDDLLPYPGLWRAIKFGALQRLHQLKCDEELLRYLRHIKAVWSSIVSGIDESNFCDASSVEYVQLLAPGIFITDREKIESAFAREYLFPGLGPELRDTVLSNLCSSRHMIPSLCTFFEYLKCIEPCCEVLRTLFGVSPGYTIRQSAEKCFERQPCLSVETRHNDLSRLPITLEDDIQISYTQLWLFALREFPHLMF